MSEIPAPRAHDPYEAFRYRDYCFFAAGNLLSVLGKQMLAVAIGWEVYQRTHSAAMLGCIGLLFSIARHAPAREKVSAPVADPGDNPFVAKAA